MAPEILQTASTVAATLSALAAIFSGTSALFEANPEFRTVLNWNFRHNFHDVERRLCREEVEVHGRADRVCAEAG